MAIQHEHPAADSPDLPRQIRPWVWNPQTRQIDVTRRPQAGEPEPDHFAILGVPRRLLLEPETLEIAHRSLIRGLHPDRFHQQGPQAVADAQWHSSRVNDAWRSLKTLEQRARYVLILAGENPEERYQPSPQLLGQMLEANEAIDEAEHDPAQLATWLGEFQREAAGLAEKLARAAAAWDRAESAADGEKAAAARAELRAVLGESRYVHNLLARAEAALAASPS